MNKAMPDQPGLSERTSKLFASGADTSLPAIIAEL
jgi:hypothetical protein